MAVNNLVIWVKTILIETLNEFYEHVLEENLELIEEYERMYVTRRLFCLNVKALVDL